MVDNNTISLSLSKEQSMMLKCVAICAMLWHHLFACKPKVIPADFDWLTLTLGDIGKVCVAMFLFVSGYGLYKQYNKLVISEIGGG